MPSEAPVRALLTATSLWWSARAGASEVVVYDGDAATALAHVTAAGGPPAADLRPLRLADVLPTRPPVLVGPGRLDPCTGTPTTNAQVAEATAAAERSVAFLEFADALAGLDTAAATLGCLSEPADAHTAARVAFLRGLALFHSDDEDGARAAFRQAHLFEPTLTWDERYAPDPKALFDDALTDLTRLEHQRLQVVPGPADLPVYVDGARVAGPVSLPPGLHLVQIGHQTTATVRLDLVDDTTLVFPGLVPADALAWAADPARSAALSTVLAAVVGQGFAAWVVHGDQTFQVVTGTARFDRVERPPAAPDPVTPAPPPLPPVAHRHPSWLLVGTGGAFAVTGAAIAGVTWAQGRNAYGLAVAADERAAFREQRKRYDRLRGEFVVGSVLGGLGAAAALGGVAIRHGGAEVTAGPGAVTVTWTLP